MGFEIERKYLVDHEKWQQVDKPAGLFCRQGYLVNEPAKTVRVRVMGARGYITIKGPTTGIGRPEYEYEIPSRDAIELLDQFAVSALTKTRYTLVAEGNTWEVDEFAGDNEGLIVAEIELDSADAVFTLPEWADREVSGDDKYYNVHLAAHPYKEWK